MINFALKGVEPLYEGKENPIIKQHTCQKAFVRHVTLMYVANNNMICHKHRLIVRGLCKDTFLTTIAEDRASVKM